MRKIFSIIAIAAISVCLCACSQQQTQPQSDASSSQKQIEQAGNTVKEEFYEFYDSNWFNEFSTLCASYAGEVSDKAKSLDEQYFKQASMRFEELSKSAPEYHGSNVEIEALYRYFSTAAAAMSLSANQSEQYVILSKMGDSDKADECMEKASESLDSCDEAFKYMTDLANKLNK